MTSQLEAKHWDHGWLLGWRDICRSTDERTVISARFRERRSGDKSPLCFIEWDRLISCRRTLSSFALDYAARQKLGRNFT